MNTLESKIKKPKLFSFFFWSPPFLISWCFQGFFPPSPAEHATNCQDPCLCFFFWKKKKERKKKRATNTQKKSWKERESACKCSNYSSSNAPVIDIPISFNAGLLYQLTSPAWFLIFELNPSRATYKELRLTRGSRVATGKVGRIVLMVLHTHTHTKASPSDEEKKASATLFRNAPRPRFVLIFLFSSKKMNWRPPAPPSTPLPCSNTTSCQCQWLLLLLLLPLSRWILCSQLMKCTTRQTKTAVRLSLLLLKLATSGASTRFQSANALLLYVLSLLIFSSHKA